MFACRFKEDQVFGDIIETQIKAVTLIDGEWYVRLDGDLAGKVVGAVYDASAGDTTLVPLALSVSCWAGSRHTDRQAGPSAPASLVRLPLTVGHSAQLPSG